MNTEIPELGVNTERAVYYANWNVDKDVRQHMPPAIKVGVLAVRGAEGMHVGT